MLLSLPREEETEECKTLLGKSLKPKNSFLPIHRSQKKNQNNCWKDKWRSIAFSLTILCILFIYRGHFAHSASTNTSSRIVSENFSNSNSEICTKIGEQSECIRSNCAWRDSSCSTQCQWKEGVVYIGKEMRTKSVSQIQECEMLCLSTLTCVAFTVMPSACTIFNSTSKTLKWPDAISGVCASDLKFSSESTHRSGRNAQIFTRKSKNVAIIMADSRGVIDDLKKASYPSLTAVINSIYAKKWGYDFFYYHFSTRGSEKVAQACKKDDYGRPVMWCKLLVIYKHILELKYEWIVWLDTDAAILNHDIQVGEYLDDLDYQHFHEDSVIILENDWTPHRGYPGTTGVFFLKPNLMGLHLIYEWWNTLEFTQYHFEGYYEQDAFWYGVTKWHNGMWNFFISVTNTESFHSKEGQYVRHICSGEEKAFNNRVTTFHRYITHNLNIGAKEFAYLARNVNVIAVKRPLLHTLRASISSKKGELLLNHFGEKVFSGNISGS